MDRVFGGSKREPRREEYVTSMDRRIASRAGRLSSRDGISYRTISPAGYIYQLQDQKGTFGVSLVLLAM